MRKLLGLRGAVAGVQCHDLKNILFQRVIVNQLQRIALAILGFESDACLLDEISWMKSMRGGAFRGFAKSFRIDRVKLDRTM